MLEGVAPWLTASAASAGNVERLRCPYYSNLRAMAWLFFGWTCFDLTPHSLPFHLHTQLGFRIARLPMGAVPKSLLQGTISASEWDRHWCWWWLSTWHLCSTGDFSVLRSCLLKSFVRTLETSSFLMRPQSHQCLSGLDVFISLFSLFHHASSSASS